MLVGFITVALLLGVMGNIAIREVNTLAELTEKMYLHPLTVSNAVLEANTNIIAMHRYMKDVVLARNKKHLDEAVSMVDAEEKLVYQHFDLVMQRFLGDKSKIRQARQTFAGWKTIRSEVIQLTLQQKYNKAAAITRGKGAQYVVLLTTQMDGLIEFARNKAMEFRLSSQSAHSQSVTYLNLLMTFLLLLVAMISIFSIVSVKRGQKQLELNEKKFRNLFDTMAQGIVYQDKVGHITSANLAATQILGLSLDQMKGRSSIDPGWQSIHENGENFPPATHPAMQALRTHSEVKNVVMGVLNPDKGLHHWVLINSKPVTRAGQSEPYQVFSTYTDITERKQAEEELRKLSQAVESSSSAVFIVDKYGVIEYTNPKFSEITGYSRQEAIGKNPCILQSGKTDNAVYAELWETITAGKEWKGKFYNRKKDGSYYWAQESISAVKDVDGNITHFISIQEDVTHEYELSEKLNYQATHDLLTGLINRREFERRAERLLMTTLQDNAEHALCFMDLDQFKVINDTCGHIAGDELLRQLGRLLSDTIRKRDSLARLGGDEFGVLMEHCSLEQAERVANEILQSIQDYQFLWEGKSFHIGISIGLVSITKDIPNLTELLKFADAACYMAKDLGRNRIHLYHPDDIELAQRQGEMQWVTRIDKALEEHRFCLYAQPIVPLDGSQGKHCEILIRMLDEQGNIIPPGAFLTAAERYNLIGVIDAWVIKKAFSLLAANPRFVEKIHFVSINLSGASLTSSSFLEFISTQLRQAGIEANKICFEVTETVAISNLNAAISFITILKDMGFRFALDDFGSGLSSFGYLKTLPVDYLKIDGMFVKDMVDDPIDYAMVKSINDIGHVMGLQTIAEFVENDDIKEMLCKIGVNYAQGYGTGKPRPFEEILEQFIK